MSSHADDPNRRDFLAIAGTAFAAVGGAISLWPFIAQMNPDAGALALGSIEVDLSQIKEGQAATYKWRGKPLFVRHRTKKEIEEARAVPLNVLPHRETDSQRVKPGKEQWLVMVGVCTHFGCTPKGQQPGDLKGNYNGWFCVCHGSEYDTSGRIRNGPAPFNLEVPEYAFLNDTTIKVG